MLIDFEKLFDFGNSDFELLYLFGSVAGFGRGLVEVLGSEVNEKDIYKLISRRLDNNLILNYIDAQFKYSRSLQDSLYHRQEVDFRLGLP
jgi:hypothetical protein